MQSTGTAGSPIRIASAGHAAYAVTMIALGVMGLATGDFVQVWQPVPTWVPAHVAYLCALVSLGSGFAMLWRRAAPTATRVLFGSLLVWLSVLRLPNLLYQTPRLLVAWSFGETAVMTAGAWVLCVSFANERAAPPVGFFTDARGLRIARALYGVSLIPFGLAHFAYLDRTTVLIPGWLPWHVAWAYATGAAFIAAGLAVVLDVLPRLAATLSMLQFASFGLIVWAPRVVAGTVSDFQRGEFITTCALTAGAWVIADSYRGTPWFALRRRSRGE